MRAVAALAVLAAAALAAGAQAAEGSSSHPFDLEWGGSGIGKDGLFLSPQAAAAGPDGSVYVTDLGNKRVQKFSPSGEHLASWGGPGDGEGQFRSPAGVAAHGGHVYVSDGQLNRVQKFTEAGEFVAQWGGPGDGPSEFLLPGGVAAGPDGTVYVADTGNHRVQRFTADGEYVSELGSSGTGPSGFVSPVGVAVGRDGAVYVSDPGSGSVKKFRPDGELAASFDSWVGGSPLRAEGIHAAPGGGLYAADAAADRIVLLGPGGSSVSIWGTTGTGPGQFKMPRDVALDASGHLYVVDSNGHRVQKFATPASAPPAPPGAGAPAQGQAAAAAAPRAPAAAPVPGDITRPSITPPNDLVIEATGALTAVDVGRASASDESGIRSLESNAPSSFTLGINTVIWTAIDGSGNMAIATQTVTVTDTVPPSVSAPPPARAEAAGPGGTAVDLGAPSASDAVGVMSVESDAPELFPLGTTLVTWTARDVAGNEASAAQEVVVADTRLPDLRAPPAVEIEAASPEGTPAFLGEPFVSDNGEIISVTNDAPALFPVGNTTVTWMAADASGNAARAAQLVTVADTTPPVIAAPAPAAAEAESASATAVALEPPAVSDVQNFTVTSDAPASFPLGTTAVTWTATDAAGNSASAVQEVTVADTTPPEIAAPPAVSAEAAGPEGAPAGLGEAAVSDATGISYVENDAPATFPIGTTVVTWRAGDGHGNAANATQAVTVSDTVPPSVYAPPAVVAEAAGPEGAAVDVGAATASDAVGVASLSSDAPATFPIGLTTVTWTARDAAGNEASASQAVTVLDTVPPSVSAPPAVVAEAAGPGGQAVAIGGAEAADAVGVESLESDAPDAFPIGLTTVTWTARDAAGNEASASQNVTVSDTVPPSVSPPPDASAEAAGPEGAAVDVGAATASDAVGVASLASDAPAIFPLGETVVTWTARDAAGNEASAAQLVTVSDTVPPEVSPPPDVVVEAESGAGSAADVGSATASDAVGVASLTSDAPAAFPIGETVVTWTARDAAGNEASATQAVRVEDTVPPSLYAPPPAEAEAAGPEGAAVEYGTATASDAVGVASLTSDAPATFPLGLTTVTWTARDAAGNEYSAAQQVVVYDTVPPEVSPPPDASAEAAGPEGAAVDVGTATASDAVGVASLASDAPAIFPLGETVVTWTARDAAGNEAAGTQIVTVSDTVPPSVSAPPDASAEAAGPEGAAVDVGAATASDAVGVASLASDAPAAFPIGETVVTWTARDAAGNEAAAVQLVTVSDTVPPEVIPPPDVVVEAESGAGNAADVGSANATDAVGVASISSDAPDTFPYGTTVVTWTARDAAGNEASAAQEVSVVDTAAPWVSAPPDVVAEAEGPGGARAETGTASAGDAVGVALVASDAPDVFPLGTTVVTWRAEDLDGNAATAVQRVTVADTTPPELVPPGGVEVDAEALLTAAGIGGASASDLVDASPSVSHDAPAEFALGETVVTWTARDAAGNEANATQAVTVTACGRDASHYNLITGTDGDDVLRGTDMPDLIFALGGDDMVFAGRGGDCVFAGPGDDIVFGGAGADDVRAGPGNDIVRGQSGGDSVRGGPGADIIDGGDDGDACSAAGGPDGDVVAKCERGHGGEGPAAP